jgi:hypothetical protein
MTGKNAVPTDELNGKVNDLKKRRDEAYKYYNQIKYKAIGILKTAIDEMREQPEQKMTKDFDFSGILKMLSKFFIKKDDKTNAESFSNRLMNASSRSFTNTNETAEHTPVGQDR